MSDEPARWWQQVDWPGAIGFVLALGISISMVTIIILGSLVTGMTEHSGANLLSTMFGAAIGALATYLGQSGPRRINGSTTK